MELKSTENEILKLECNAKGVAYGSMIAPMMNLGIQTRRILHITTERIIFENSIQIIEYSLSDIESVLLKKKNLKINYKNGSYSHDRIISEIDEEKMKNALNFLKSKNIEIK